MPKYQEYRTFSTIWSEHLVLMEELLESDMLKVIHPSAKQYGEQS